MVTNYIVHIPETTIELFEDMLLWLRQNVGYNGFQYYEDIPSGIQIHFTSTEHALIFKLKFAHSNLRIY